jgi:lipoprotein-anchoring transpeptidase ErfK/SrfK
MRVVVALLVIGCGSKDAPSVEPPSPSTPPVQGTNQPPDPLGVPVMTPPDFPESTRSLELLRTVGVRLEPGDGAKRIGTVAVDTRVGWSRTQKAKGCTKPWIEIRPRGWICGDYVKPSTKAAFGREVPYLERGEMVPGVYGKVVAPNSVTYVIEKPKVKETRRRKNGPVTSPDADAGKPAPKLIEGKPLVGSVNVRQYDELVVDGKAYWKISQKDPEYVLGQSIMRHRPSLYGGSRLGDDTGWTIPIAFVWPRVIGWQQASTSYKAGGGGQVRMLAARTPIPIVETFSDKAGKAVAYRIGEEEWIAAADVRVFNPAPKPALLGPNERWIDIDLDNQILVAFEGDVAVYSTMVSSGGKETPTDLGIYRMWLKESEADMKGLNGEDPYSVATVPWTQFFSPEKGLALHTAYWHDQFGVRRSHGCVNLAPRDARWLYFWSDPQVPAGWTMAAGVVEAPGSIVRVRNKETPQPELRGYAKKVNEARLQNAAVK